MSSIAVAEGCCRLNWIVNESNARGIAFYERMGAAVLPEYRLCCVDEAGLASLLDR